MNASEYDQIYKNNLRFHVLTALGWYLAGSVNPTAEQIAAVKVPTVATAPIGEMAQWVIRQVELTEKT